MALFGMVDAETMSTHRFQNWRRRVFYDYPNGTASLMAVLSLMQEEPTNDPVINWHEKRHVAQFTTTAANTTGVFTDASNVDLTGSGLNIAVNTVIRVVVTTTDIFRVGHTVEIPAVPINGGGTASMYGIVTATGVNGSKKYIAIRVIEAIHITNGATTVGLQARVIGSAFAEGQEDTSRGIYNTPLVFSNYTEIFRRPYVVSGTALKTATKFDARGVFPDLAKEAAINHMEEIEKAVIFGRKSLYTNSDGLTVRTMDGIISFLKQWEAGTSYGVSSSSLNSDDGKRIININGNISEASYDEYQERLFRVTNSKANEKLCLCGSGFLSVLNQLYKSKSVLNVDVPHKDTYGMSVVKHVGPFGTIWYKTHPLFTQNPSLRYNALFLDVNNIVYRPLQGRDTQLIPNRQNNSTDGIKNEWLTEATIEVRFPESHMYLVGVTGYSS